jgi:Na+-transporting NADH:ubiquinone oxidoreductase subunit NqrF
MKLYKEESLSRFEFWSGAKDRAEKLTDQEFDQIESMLNELYPDGMDETQLNDFFWFDFETIAEWLGTTEEEILERD